MDNIAGKIREHQYEMGVSGRLMRARAVEEQLTGIEQELLERKERFEKQEAGTVAHSMNKKMILALIAQRKKLLREFEYALTILMSKKDGTMNGVTEAEIERARFYPISDLIEVKRGMARCIAGSHEDRNPSMDTRNNYCHCYTCQWGGDSIAVYMKLHGVTFPEAVRALQ